MVPLDERSDAGLLATKRDLYADLDFSVDDSSVDSTVRDEEEERKRKKAETLDEKDRCDRAMCCKILAFVLGFIVLNVGILLGKTLQSKQDGKPAALVPISPAPIPSPITSPPALFSHQPSTLTPIATAPPSALVATAAPTPAVITKQPTVHIFGGFGFGGGGLFDATQPPVSAAPTPKPVGGALLIVAPRTDTPTAYPSRSPTTPASVFENIGFGGGVTPTDSPVSPPTATIPPSNVATTTALLPNGATVVSTQTLPPPPPENGGFGSGGFGV